MLKETLSSLFNIQSKTVNNAIIQLGDIDDSEKGRPFKSRFIQAGIAGYPNQFGTVLITKETLDKFVHTLEGKPVIINHKDNITPEDEVGKVELVWFNPEDGWFWCSGYLKDEKAIDLIKNKHWSVSCSYDVLLLDDEGGTENNVKYDQEFLNGVFTHLAIVENPRYERANIVVNSKTKILNDAEFKSKHEITNKLADVFKTANGSTPTSSNLIIAKKINNLNPNITNTKQTFEEKFTDVFFEALAEVLLESKREK